MKLHLHHKLFIAFIAWCAVSTAFSDYFLMSLQGFYPYRGEGLITLLIVTCLGFSYWKAFDSIKPMAWTCLAFCVAMITMSYWFHGLNYDRLFFPDTARSSFSCLAGPLAMILNPFMCIVAIVPICETGTRSAIVALLIGALAYLLFTRTFKFNRRNVMIGIVVGVLALGVSLKYGDSKLSRVPHSLGHGPRTQWLLQGDTLAQELPLTGYGVDTLSNYLSIPTMKGYEDLKRFVPDRTHWLPMDIILMTGWCGYTIILLSFGYAIGIAYKWPTKDNVACLSVLVAYVMYGMLNPHCALSESVAITCLLGIRKNI